MVREVSSRCSTAGSWQSSTALSFSMSGSLAAANGAWIDRAHPHPPYRRAGSKQRSTAAGWAGSFLVRAAELGHGSRSLTLALFSNRFSPGVDLQWGMPTLDRPARRVGTIAHRRPTFNYGRTLTLPKPAIKMRTVSAGMAKRSLVRFGFSMGRRPNGHPERRRPGTFQSRAAEPAPHPRHAPAECW